MKKYLIIYLIAVACMQTIASGASAQGRLWMAIEAAHNHASDQMDRTRVSQPTTSENRQATGRLWMARQNAIDKLEQSGTIQNMTRHDDTNASKIMTSAPSKNRPTGGRLWMARQNAIDKLEQSGTIQNMARNRDKNSPESISNTPKEKPYYCKPDRSDSEFEFERYGRFLADREKCS